MLLAVAVAFTAMPDTGVYAGEVRQNLPMEGEISEAGEADIPVYRLVKKGEPSKSGYQDMVWVNEDGKEVTYEASRQKSRARARVPFPSSYSMLDEGELPAVRNQGQWGTCWAHAAICSVETNMVKKGLIAAEDVDYSERHLSYFSHRRNEALGDGEDIFHDTYSWYGGGHHYSAIATLASWSGAADERDYPYVSYGTMENLAESDRSASVCHLTDANILSTPEDVKYAVMNTGALMCSYYSGDGTVESAQGNVYHAEAHAIDHSVSLVGWNDNYPKTNFSDNGRMPENNGAWLCRNSWGPDCAENGYFWISYEDATLTNFCSFEAESLDNYDCIYQYDGAGWNLGIGSEKVANVFTAESLEKLRAVSFYTNSNIDYLIEIYTGSGTSVKAPLDGTLAYSQTGTVQHPGYHTISLDEEVLLAGGMKYAVSVKFLPKNGEQAFFCVEYGDSFSSEAGQSFLWDGVRWKDTQEYGYKNVCIKAFTDRVERVDKSDLLALIEEVENLESADYVAETWEKLCVKLEQAKAVCQAPDAAELEVIKAMRDLRAAKDSLAVSSIYLSDENEFEAFAQEVLAGKDYDGQTVYLLNDLDMTGVTHREIGNISAPFMGTFDGGGHTIANLVYAGSYSYGGLFGCVGENGTVKNVKLTNVNLTLGDSFSGSLAGVNQGTISGCSIEGNVRIESDNGAVGGVAGDNQGRIETSSFNGTLIFQNQTQKDAFAGGVAGHNEGNIDRCFMEGEIVSDGLASTGGIVGYSDEGSEISRCYNLAVISGAPSEETRTAGIGVCLYGTTYGCYNYGDIRRRAGEEFGAVYCYKGDGDISNCYYRNTGGIRGGYSPSSDLGSMTEEQFASAKVAYYLNSSGGTEANTYEWSQKNGAPVWADDANKAVIKVRVRQLGEKGASLNGVAEGEFYAKGGTEVELRSLDAIPGYRVSVEVIGLTRSGKGGKWYLLPEKDTSVFIRYQKTPIPNEFQNGRKEMTGIGCYQVLDAKKKTAVLIEVTNKKAAKMNVPATVKIAGVTCKVTAIGDGVFKNGSSLKKVILGKYVTTIGKQAFMKCKKLKSVQLKGSALKTVKAGAFKKTAAKITVSAKKMKKNQKAALWKKLRRAGISKKAKVK